MTALPRHIRNASPYLIDTETYPFNGKTNKEIDDALCADLLLGLKQYPKELLYRPGLSEPKAKWKVMSSLQKSVRRGDVKNALKAAHALYSSDPKNFFRRFSVIVIEDVGLANPVLVALILTIAGRFAWIRAEGDQVLVAYLVESACLSTKDRTLTDIAYGAWIATYTQDLKKACIQDYAPDEMASIADYHSDADILIKQVCMLALGGCIHSDEGRQSHFCKRSPEYLSKVIESYNLDTLLEYITTLGAKRGVEGLALAVPLLASALVGRPVPVIDVDLPPTPIIGRVPALAYDKHVMEGKRAYAYFMKYCKPVATWLKDNDYRGNAVEFIGSALFNGESGSVLGRMLIYPEQEALFRLGLVQEAAKYGVTPDKMYEFYALVNQHHDDVNYSRRRIINGKIPHVSIH